MSVLDRSSLEASPLADIHAIASELLIDGYRRLRRADLIDAILNKQGGGDGAASQPEADAKADTPERKPARERRPARAPKPKAAAEAEGPAVEAEGPAAPAAERAAEAAEPAAEAAEPAAEAAETNGAAAATAPDKAKTAAEAESGPDDGEGDRAPTKRRRGRRGGRGAEPEAESGDDEEQLVEGVVELLANGSGFVRVDPPDPSDDDVYISSAQVKRCELVSGDRIAGPKRAPRRSERFASLIRIETINGRPASELADSVRFDDLPAAFPSQRIKVGSDDPTLKAIEWLTPFGKGSRVTIVGAPRAGKTEALRRLAAALAGHEDLTLTVVLAGVRPEEFGDWTLGGSAPAAAISFAASEDAQSAAIEPVIDQARRLAARGADAVVLIDTLDGCSPQMARKALASARNIVDGGSVTVIATAREPVGGETTVIALDVALTSLGRFPALDILASGTVRPELLVGDAGAEAIARARAEATETEDDE
jgi:transcription termination factor Rho